MTKTAEDSEWHLDKKVPIGLLLMIIAQTITLAYIGISWKSDTDNRISNLERQGNRIDKNTDINSNQDNRITVLETQFANQKEILIRIDTTLNDLSKRINK